MVKRSMGEARTFTMHGIDHTPESISALILRHLFEDVQQALGSDDNSVVITVPAYFGMRETQATIEAGTLAGLNVVSTIPEPIAAALHYGCAPGQLDRDVAGVRPGRRHVRHLGAADRREEHRHRGGRR